MSDDNARSFFIDVKDSFEVDRKDSLRELAMSLSSQNKNGVPYDIRGTCFSEYT